LYYNLVIVDPLLQAAMQQQQYANMHPSMMQANYSSTINSAHQIAQHIFNTVRMGTYMNDLAMSAIYNMGSCDLGFARAILRVGGFILSASN